MPNEIRVIPIRDLIVSTPSVWQRPSNRLKQYASQVEDGISRLSSDGWDLVTCFKEPLTGVSMFVFSRNAVAETGIKPA